MEKRRKRFFFSVIIRIYFQPGNHWALSFKFSQGIIFDFFVRMASIVTWSSVSVDPSCQWTLVTIKCFSLSKMFTDVHFESNSFFGLILFFKEEGFIFSVSIQWNPMVVSIFLSLAKQRESLSISNKTNAYRSAPSIPFP